MKSSANMEMFSLIFRSKKNNNIRLFTMIRIQLKARLAVTRPFVSSVRRLSTVQTPDPEYTAEPKYPPIVDPSPKAEKRREEERWHDKLKSHPTLEEKLIEINMPKYYGWHSVMLHERQLPYNLLPMVKFITRTSMIEEETLTNLPDGDKIAESAEELLPLVKGNIENVILFQNCSKSSGSEQKKSTDQLLVQAINRIILSTLAPSVPHLNDIEMSHNPRLEAFWFVGGIDDAPIDELEYFFRQEFYKGHQPFTKDRGYQYIGEPILQVRSQQPLPETASRETFTSTDHNIEEFPYDPTTVYNFENKYRHAVILPGFWPGSHYEFGCFSFQSRTYVDNRSSEYEPQEHVDAAHASAILSSYSWLLGQACYQGFSTFQDVTYPLVTQTALTDGRLWSFYLYQLNTTLVHHEYSMQNKYHNVCWGTKTQALFDSIENGRIVGFNDDVLKQILKMYLVTPRARPGLDMKPYLAEKHLIHHIDYEERRDWLHLQLRHLAANKPTTRIKKEPTTDQKIFLTYYPTDRIKKPLYWFQLGIDPNDKRLDDRHLKYRPKALRTKKTQKYYKYFYPGTNTEYDPNDPLS